jgi:hypothetical protein
MSYINTTSLLVYLPFVYLLLSTLSALAFTLVIILFGNLGVVALGYKYPKLRITGRYSISLARR